MNKQELIEKYEKLEGVWNANGAEIARQCFLRDLEQLNETDTKKVTVPQFIADWIEKCKNEKKRLHEALTYTPSGVNGWVSIPKNQETFARAWLDGFEIEKEKRYLVKIKGVSGDARYLNSEVNGDWYINSKQETRFFKALHTRKELEEASFGWVFDCEGVEVKEVEE